jgi:hypothetical protein
VGVLSSDMDRFVTAVQGKHPPGIF